MPQPMMSPYYGQPMMYNPYPQNAFVTPMNHTAQPEQPLPSISLKGKNNLYISVDKEKLVYSSGICQENEKLIMETLPNGKVALRSIHNTYIGTDANGKVHAVENCKESEQFSYEIINSKVALKSSHNTYLGLDSSKVHAVQHCKESEQFEVVKS